MKAKNGAFIIHLVSFVIVDISTLVFGIWILTAGGEDQSSGDSQESEDVNKEVHGLFGIIIIILVVAQHILGVASKLGSEKK